MGSHSVCVQFTFIGVYNLPGCGVRETNKTQFPPSESAPLSLGNLSVLFSNKPKPLSLMTEEHDSWFRLCQLPCEQSMEPFLVCEMRTLQAAPSLEGDI